MPERMIDPWSEGDSVARHRLVRARRVTLAICAFLGIALSYACIASLDVVVSAQGRVVAAGHSKTIQPAEAGVVQRVLVRDGQPVRAGDLLVELDDTQAAADRARLERDEGEARADVARLGALVAQAASWQRPDGLPDAMASHQQALFMQRRAEQAARVASLQAEIARREAERDGAATHLEQAGRTEPLVQRKLALREELARSGYIAENALIDARMEALQAEREGAVQAHRLREAQAALAAARVQLTQLEADFRARHQTELIAALQRRDALSQELVKVRQRHALHALRSPVDGVVQQLAVTTPGAVVSAAQALLVVVPAHPSLEVEARVHNRDIGHVQVGQRVAVKAEAFDFTRYGALAGTVSWVGGDAVVDPDQGPMYPVRIQLEATHTPQSGPAGPGRLGPGMAVAADIRTSERRLIDYFLSPLLRYRHEALRER